MSEACKLSGATLADNDSVIVKSHSGKNVYYNKDDKTYTMNTVAPKPDMSLDSLKMCFWNCNTWNRLKALKVAQIANEYQLNIICITDSRIDSWRPLSAVNSFARILGTVTAKVWKGSVTPKYDGSNVGGDIIMYSDQISKPSIRQVIPCGVLTELTCR